MYVVLFRQQSHQTRILKFEGIILRSQLAVLLKNQIYYSDCDQVSVFSHSVDT